MHRTFVVALTLAVTGGAVLVAQSNPLSADVKRDYQTVRDSSEKSQGGHRVGDAPFVGDVDLEARVPGARVERRRVPRRDSNPPAPLPHGSKQTALSV